MTEEENKKPLDLIFRRRAAYQVLSEVLSGTQLIQAMWMIEERDHAADRLTFLGIVGVTAELCGIENHIVSNLYLKLNKTLTSSDAELPADPYPEMLNFQGIKKSDSQQALSEALVQNQQSPVVGTTSSIFRAHDILGIVEKDLTNRTVYQIGQAVATEAKQHNCSTMIIARDNRNSSIELGQMLAQGILSTGLNVIDLGTVPISVLNFVIYHFDGRGGIMISGGHHASEYNGLKLVVAGEKLEGEKIQQIKQRIDTSNFVTGEPGILEKNSTFIDEYIGMICEDMHIINALKIVVDCGNGIASKIAIKLIQAIGCEVIELKQNKTASQTHGKLTDLIAMVQEHKADIGISFDNEGARFRAVDSQGEIIRPDRQMMLFAKTILASHPVGEIIHDTQNTGHLANYIGKCGGRPMLWKAGSASMKNQLKQTAAKLAGDMHGHIYFNDRWFGFDDALYAVCRLLEILSSESRPSSEILAELPVSLCSKSIIIKVNQGEGSNIIANLIKEADFPGEKTSTMDVLRIDFPEGWALIRTNISASSLVVHFEAPNTEMINTLQKQLKPLFLKINPDIELPY